MQQNQENETLRKTQLSALPERHSAPSEDFMRALAAWQRLKTRPAASPKAEDSGAEPMARA
jgi:hypothetical protein